MKSYKELEVWKISCELVLEIYKITNIFPSDEKFGLTSQMRRAAISIPSNIAEGFTRRTIADNRNFLRIALASGAELETQLYLVNMLQLIPTKNFSSANFLLDRVMRMLNKLGQSLISGQERLTSG